MLRILYDNSVSVKFGVVFTFFFVEFAWILWIIMYDMSYVIFSLFVPTGADLSEHRNGSLWRWQVV